MLELYHNNISVCAQKVRVVLAEKNQPWTNHHLSLAKGEQKQGVSAGKTSKADLIAALKQSFDYCDSVYDSMTDAAGAAKVNMFGRQMTKLGVLNFNTMHNNEMYGTMVAYLRIKGIVPPSSEGRP